MIDLNIVVPTYNNWDETLSNFSHLTSFKDMLEVVIIDNNEISNLPRNIPDCFRVIHEPNPGSYAARNAGIMHANSRYIFFTDSDCYVPDETIKLILSLSKSTLNVYAGPTLINYSKADNVYCLFDKLFAFDFHAMKESKSAITANLLVPSKFFREYGLFNSDTYSGGDVEWTKNYSTYHHIIYKEKMKVFHPPRSTLSQLKTKVRRVVGGRWKTLSIFKNFILVLSPPARRLKKVIFSDLSPFIKIKLILLLTYLKLIEFQELIMLIFGKSRERT